MTDLKLEAAHQGLPMVLLVPDVPLSLFKVNNI
jgi:hypothetical protein